MNEINAYIEEIKNYSEKNTELKKSHHFCFNIPISIGNTKPELKQGDEIVLIMGQNPGELDGTWNYLPKNLESKTKDLFIKMKSPKEIKEKVAEMVANKQQISGILWKNHQIANFGMMMMQIIGEIIKRSQLMTVIINGKKESKKFQ